MHRERQACTFFGHRECYSLDKQGLLNAIEELISKGVDTFYVGNQGQFDRMVYHCLKQLKKEYLLIHICVVLTYLPTGKREGEDISDTMYPEGLETVHPKYAIDKRNKWMIANAGYCVCYINHTWGGAYKFAKMALRHGKRMINLGSIEIQSGGLR